MKVGNNMTFDWWFKLACEYKDEHGDLLVPKEYKTESGKNLGSWIKEKRKYYFKNKLTTEQIEKLESIGMVWKVHEQAWDDMFALAVEYANEHGNLLVPQKYITENGKPLGIWISNCRIFYKNDKLSQEKIESLESIGMIWQVHDKKWDDMYAMVSLYYPKHGNLFIDDSSTLPDMKKLKKWLIYQRNLCIKGKLSEEKKKALESIGMVWDAKLSKENINIHLEELTVTIDKEKNKNVLKYISAIELQTKIRFLSDIGESPVDENGRLIDIFTMSNHDTEEKYGVNIESLIKYYKKDNTRKLKIKL